MNFKTVSIIWCCTRVSLKTISRLGNCLPSFYFYHLLVLLKICSHATLMNLLTLKFCIPLHPVALIFSPRPRASNAKRTIFLSHIRICRRDKKSRVIYSWHVGRTASRWSEETNRTLSIQRCWIEFIIPASRKEKWPQDLSSEPPPISIYLLVLRDGRPATGSCYFPHTRINLSPSLYRSWSFDGSLLSPACERASSFTPQHRIAFCAYQASMRSHRMTDVVQRVYQVLRINRTQSWMNTTGGKSAELRRHFGESISSGSKFYGFGEFQALFSAILRSWEKCSRHRWKYYRKFKFYWF